MPPPLVVISRSLPPKLQALPHVIQLMSNFLMPTTIDAAVYNNLQCVLQVYESSLPCTVGAMDGSAARGRLDIVQRLYHSREEGCSNAAFTGAACSGHLDVLLWLYEKYPMHAHTPTGVAQQLESAAANGHFDVVRYLTFHDLLTRDGLKAAQVAAAANGHVTVVEYFLLVGNGTYQAFNAAATNGHVPVLELYLNQRRLPVVSLHLLLQKAIEGGHIDAIQFLMEKADEVTTYQVFDDTAETLGADVLKLILERCLLSPSILVRILQKATTSMRCEIVQVLIGQCPAVERDCPVRDICSHRRCSHTTHIIIFSALTTAARIGHVEMVNILLEKAAVCTGDALCCAIIEKQWPMAEHLLTLCDGKHFSKSFMKNLFNRTWLDTMLKRYAANNNVEITQLIVTKFGDLDIDDALKVAVKSGALGVVKVLAEKAGPYFISKGFVDAAANGNTEMVKALLAFVDQDTVEKALEKSAAIGSVELSSLLLARCKSDSHRYLFQNAAQTNNVNVVQLLLNEMDQCSINRALTTAAGRGFADIVEILMDKSQPSARSFALEIAALEGDCKLIQLLRSQCDSIGIESAVAKARAVGHDEVIMLLCSKKARTG